MLSTCTDGTFLLRFSDSELGGVTIAWVEGMLYYEVCSHALADKYSMIFARLLYLNRVNRILISLSLTFLVSLDFALQVGKCTCSSLSRTKTSWFEACPIGLQICRSSCIFIRTYLRTKHSANTTVLAVSCVLTDFLRVNLKDWICLLACSVFLRQVERSDSRTRHKSRRFTKRGEYVSYHYPICLKPPGIKFSGVIRCFVGKNAAKVFLHHVEIAIKTDHFFLVTDKGIHSS